MTAGHAPVRCRRPPGQDGGELRLAAGALQADDELTRHGGGGLTPMVFGDEREIDSGGDAAEVHTLPS